MAVPPFGRESPSNATGAVTPPTGPRGSSLLLYGALGPAVVQLEHVGSTSVPGLVAKPIIDILLVVRDSADEPSYVPALTGVGYRLVIREPDWLEHRLLKGPDTDINLHVFTAGADVP